MLMTPKETADYLRMSEATLRKWRWEGRKDLRHIKIGKKVLYSLDHIQSFIERQTRKSTSENCKF